MIELYFLPNDQIWVEIIFRFSNVKFKDDSNVTNLIPKILA